MSRGWKRLAGLRGVPLPLTVRMGRGVLDGADLDCGRFDIEHLLPFESGAALRSAPGFFGIVPNLFRTVYTEFRKSGVWWVAMRGGEGEHGALLELRG